MGSAAAAPASALADTVSFSGSRAYGANAKLAHPTLPDLTLGNVATQQLPCVPRSGTTYKNQVAEALLNSTDSNAKPALFSGTVVNSGLATFTLTDKTAPITVQERSQIESLQILHNSLTGTNLVAADVVDVRAIATRAGNGAADVSGSTTFVNLEIRGNSQSNEPPPNTVIPLDALGSKVILNEQTLLYDSAGTKVIGIRVTGIHVKLVGLLGYTGDIRIGVAQAKITPTVARLEASAYALRSQTGVSAPPASLDVTVGRQNLLILPCSGTGGTERRQPGVGVTHPTLGDVAAPLSIVNGKLVKNPLFTTYTYAIARTAQVDLLKDSSGTPLIHADAITSVSRTARKPASGGGTEASSIDNVPSSPSTPSSGIGTSLANVIVDGNVIAGPTIPPNTKIEVPNIGRVTLNRQRCSRNGSAFRETLASDSASTPYDDSKCIASNETRFEVIAIVVEVTVPSNPFGLAAGTLVEVAAAISGVSD